MSDFSQEYKTAFGKAWLYGAYHGGDCCGRLHISNFPDVPSESALKALNAMLNEDLSDCDDDDGYYDEDDNWIENERDPNLFRNYCVEVTLTEQQATIGTMEGKTWHQILTEDLGFTQVYEFRNPNTDNKVRVYLLSDNKIG